ncbi:Uncharacterised protein [Escherichia coli]|uniref:Uncharacterized protein n=1 Tax=Escherichia coli TaxID=562 RepID=A0A376MLF0_ECOLX|nr:Uncharacterised protein [Escherichia coli]
MYGRKHYHVILLLNKDTWCSLGDFSETVFAGDDDPGGMVQRPAS